MSKLAFRKGVGVKVLTAGLLIVGLCVGWVATWSSHSQALEPVRLGIDHCGHCGMIVSDLRFSISVLDKDEQGHTFTRHFDDPGCFQAFAKEHPGKLWVGIAHDFNTETEIPLEQATFTQSTEPTPMGSGVIVVSKKK